MDIMGALAGLQDESQDEKKEEKKEAKPEAVAAVHAVEAPAKSCLVLCGSTDWVAAAKGAAGKQKQKQDGAQGDQFDSPVVVGGALAGVRVSYVSVGPSAGHVLAFGDGKVFAWGQNSHGQLGLGAKAAWVVEAVSDAVCIAAGTDFSLAGASTGKVYSWGWTEFGKLGQGDDGCYNTKDSSIKLTYTAAGAPGLVKGLPAGFEPVQVSAGKNHAAALGADGVGFTWGDGAYGKLGHRSQEQLNAPRALEGARFSSLLCGDSSTAGLGWPEYRGRPFTKTAGDGMLFVWGVLKGTRGEARRTARLRRRRAKSSHRPRSSALKGAVTAQCVASSGQTDFLCDAASVSALPVWTPPKPTQLTAPPVAKRAPPKKKGGPAAKKAKK
ncbi:hypothetical protein JL720_8206 [Aureococcus anophagefferens]|nr:hypothetical protein JL720_8206 [Aureococcus anophagefferens]